MFDMILHGKGAAKDMGGQVLPAFEELAEEVYGWLWLDGVRCMPKEESEWKNLIEPWVKLDKDKVETHRYR